MKYSIVFGLGPSGLFLGRELAKNGDNVIGIGRHDDIGLHSKYIKGYIAERKNEIVNVINEIRTKSKEKPVAYICSDQYLTLLLEEFPEVFDKFDFVGVDKRNLELINSKNLINNYCNNIGINIPNTYSYVELIEGGEVTYPLIFKLNSKHLNVGNNPIGKTRVVNNINELNRLKIEVDNSTLSIEEIVAQNFIYGDNSNQYSFGGFFKNGKELAGIVVNQLRQYPQGVSSFVKETDNKAVEEAIRELVMSFVTPIKYSGFLEMEFKINNGHVYLMDINPRPWGWVSILGKKYYNFYQLFSGVESIKLLKRDDLVTWKSPIRDIIGYFKNPMNVRGLKNRPKYSKSNTAYDIHDNSDLKPTFSIIKVGFNKILKRNR